MSGPRAGSDRDATVKLLFWLGLLVSWVILLPMLWQAFTTVPDWHSGPVYATIAA